MMLSQKIKFERQIITYIAMYDKRFADKYYLYRTTNC